ncbi:Protein URA2 [Gossypium arboreum]|uniref:Protein URA2 n=1 Tax=Gossypium arboreum TaxID=29729 RepID=A0A0B0PKK3_GOSAR|nr:Protein URA2 [Gossypium arboreum]
MERSSQFAKLQVQDAKEGSLPAQKLVAVQRKERPKKQLISTTTCSNNFRSSSSRTARDIHLKRFDEQKLHALGATEITNLIVRVLFGKRTLESQD